MRAKKIRMIENLSNKNSDIDFMISGLSVEPDWARFKNSIFDLLKSDLTVQEIPNATILANTSIIVDAENRLIRSTLNELLYWTPEPLLGKWYENSENLNLIIRERELFIKHLKDLYVNHANLEHLSYDSDELDYIFLGHAFGWHAFGHLQDSLQRLYPIRDKLKKGRSKFLVSNCDRIKDFLLHLSAYAGFNVDKSDLIVLDKNKKYVFSKLIVPYSPALLTNFTYDTYKWIISGYSDNVFNLNSNFERIPGLYLSRNHITPGFRGVLNEADFVEDLKKLGFLILNGSENLQDILKLFNAAKVIIGPHGSLFANTIFCRPDCKIVEFCPDNRVDLSFKNKFKAASNYQHILVAADEKFNIKIDASLINKIVFN